MPRPWLGLPWVRVGEAFGRAPAVFYLGDDRVDGTHRLAEHGAKLAADGQQHRDQRDADQGNDEAIFDEALAPLPAETCRLRDRAERGEKVETCHSLKLSC